MRFKIAYLVHLSGGNQPGDVECELTFDVEFEIERYRPADRQGPAEGGGPIDMTFHFVDATFYGPKGKVISEMGRTYYAVGTHPLDKLAEELYELDPELSKQVDAACLEAAAEQEPVSPY